MKRLVIKLLNKMVQKIAFHIYNDSCLQTIEMGWWSKFESAHGLMEDVDG